MTASLKALVLVAAPLGCGVLLFLLTAPAQHPGVYVGTRQGVYPIFGYAEQPTAMFATVSDKAQMAPGTARGWVTFFVVGGVEMTGSCAANPQLFFVRVVDGAAPEYRPIQTDARRLDSHVCYVSSGELTHWGDATDPVVKYYYEAKAQTPKAIRVLVALTLDNPDGSREIYPVVNYPASGAPLVLPAYRPR